MNTDETYMKRCLELAKNGLGTTYPNPLVGCVIVWKDQIIGEGWHQKAGESHAEVNAINRVKDQDKLKESTLYVNLEPCSHYGKTPPCSDLIAAKGIKNIVIGTVDPNPKVAGKGVMKLTQSSTEMFVGCLEDECEELNKRFFTIQRKKRPYVILKWAQTKDGFIAPETQEPGKPFWITGSASKQLVHKWRSEEQSILVGQNTALKDNPQLNTRLWKGKNPVRILIDRNLKSFSSKERLYLLDQKNPTLVFCEHPEEYQENLNFEAIDFEKETVPQILNSLYNHGLQSLIVEGGQKTLQSFIDSDLWDEARIFTGDHYLKKGISAPVFNAIPSETCHLETDILNIYHNA